MTRIHKTAVVSKAAQLADDVEIGPFAVVEDDVRIGPGTKLGPHAVVRRFSEIGANNIIDPGAVVGGLPQHTGYDGSETWAILGDNNVLREGATVHRAYRPGAATRVGNNCFLMSNSHVAHDCIVGDNVTMANGVILGGHVEVGDHVFMGAYAGVHQFVRVGAYCMVAGYVPLRKDALPFSLIGGTPVRHYRLNTVGLRRNGIVKERYRALEAAFRALRSGNRQLDGVPDTEDVRFLRDWLARKSKFSHYGFAKPGETADP